MRLKTKLYLLLLIAEDFIRAKIMSYKTCANRYEVTFILKGIETSIRRRNLAEPDGYSREELIAMLALIRAHERKMSWKVPEPNESK